MHCKVLAIAIMASSVLGCKPNTGSGVDAVTSSDGRQSFVLAPTRLLLTNDRKSDLDAASASGMFVQMLTLSVVVCEGPAAEASATLIENYFTSTGEALRRDGDRLIQLGKTQSLPVGQCKIAGSFNAGPASIAAALTQAPSVAAQALYLGLRGPTSLNRQTAGVALYETLVENLGIRFPSLDQLTGVSRELDLLYNPCVRNHLAFDKREAFVCKTNGQYEVVGEFSGILRTLTQFVATEESRHLTKHLASGSYAAQLYQSAVRVGADLPANLSDNKLAAGNGSVLSPGRAAIAAKFSLQLETSPTTFATQTSALGNSGPNVQDKVWIESPAGRYTKDGIAFFDKVEGRWQRTVLTQAYEILEPVEKRADGAYEYRFVSSNARGFALEGVGGGTTYPAPYINPKGRQQWIADQGPFLQKAVADFRAGKTSTMAFRDQLAAVTGKMPYGKRAVDYFKKNEPATYDAYAKRVQNNEITSEQAMKQMEDEAQRRKIPFDPSVKGKQNCADISALVCQSMYPILPEDTEIGQLNVTKDGEHGHSVNYFQVPGPDGEKKFLVYDAQSGAISKPRASLDDAMMDYKFRSKMSDNYAGQGDYAIDRSDWVATTNGRPAISPFKPSEPNYVESKGLVWFADYVSGDETIHDGSRSRYDPLKMGWYTRDQATVAAGAATIAATEASTTAETLAPADVVAGDGGGGGSWLNN